MKKLNAISLILAGIICLTAFVGCGGGTDNPDDTDVNTDTSADDTSSDDTTGEDEVIDYVPEENPYTRPEENYEGVRGIALRTNIVPDANVFEGTQVTDVIIPAAMADQVVNILGENSVNVWLTLDIVNPDEDTLKAAEKALSVEGVYALELNLCAAEFEIGSEYNNLDVVTDFVAKVKEKAGAKVKIAVLVPSDINANYTNGIDIGELVSKKYVDIVSPYSGSDFNNTDIPVRLWTSLVDPYGIMLMPTISKTIKCTEKAEGYAQTSETLAADAANYIAQGADKISVGDWADAESLKVIGAYDTVMSQDRLHVLTYNNYIGEWSNNTAYLPKAIKPGAMVTVRVPIGNIPEGAKVTVLITLNPVTSAAPEMFINSKPCTYIGTDGAQTNVLAYELPAEARGDGYVVAELRGATGTTATQLEHFAVRVDVE